MNQEVIEDIECLYKDRSFHYCYYLNFHSFLLALISHTIFFFCFFHVRDDEPEPAVVQRTTDFKVSTFKVKTVRSVILGILEYNFCDTPTKIRMLNFKRSHVIKAW